MSEELRPTIDTMIVLMKSTGRYVHHRISRQDYKDIYAKFMKACIAAVDSANSIEDAIITIGYNKNSVMVNHPPTFFNKRKQEREYGYMACAHALDIVTQLNARFVTGKSDSEPRMFKNKGIVIYGDEDIFK